MATQVERIIAKSKELMGSSYIDSSGMTYCQRFVRHCYEAAGLSGSAGSAKEAGDKWIVSTSKTNIPVGAAVYFTNGNSNGHVGIYIGNNKMRHVWSKGRVCETSINVASGYRGWGWHGGQKPTGAGQTVSTTTATKKYLGVFDATAYCPCSICCGQWADGITASGKKAKANHTVAVDKSLIPLGSKLLVDGKVYYAEDTGGAIKGKRIDIYYNTHQEALSSGYGHKNVDVYLIEGDGDIDGISETSVLTSFNVVKKTVDSIPDFNKAEKSKMLRDWKNTQGMLLKIIHQDIIYDVTQLCVDSVQLVTKRRGSPAKLTFKIARDAVEAGEIVFNEGDAVALMYNETDMFWGYVFSKQRTKEQIISVVAYDQTRYLKTKETYCYTKTATEIIKTICDDYKLQMGDIAETSVTINERVEDNQSLWDIILNAIDFTMIYSGKNYLFYDDFGDITLKAYDDMLKTDCIISDNGYLIDFDYKTDIDTQTYNRIVLYKDNKETGCREEYISQDSVNEIQWGILQYTQKVSDSYTDGQIEELANRYLDAYNRLCRTFTVEYKGDPTIRAGMGVICQISDVGENMYKGAQVETCTHTFKNGEHTMKLELNVYSDDDAVQNLQE